MNRLNFCYVIDNNPIWIDLMGKGIRSLREVYGKYNPMVYIMSLNEKGGEVDIEIKELVAQSCGDMEYHFVYFDMKIAEVIPFPVNSKTLSYLQYNALSRYFIPYVVPCDYLYYVDCDLIFVEDIYDKLTNFDYQRTMLRIWHGHSIPDFHATDHVNSGFIYMNCKMWRKKKRVFSDILLFFLDNLLKIEQCDQDCFEWLADVKYKDCCIIENDLAVNQRTMYDGVEIFHGFGENKNYHAEQWEKYKKMKGID